MKLRSVHVQRFRNILDSTEVKIEDKVTCLVGKNESGKSAFLHALYVCPLEVPCFDSHAIRRSRRNIRALIRAM